MRWTWLLAWLAWLGVCGRAVLSWFAGCGSGRRWKMALKGLNVLHQLSRIPSESKSGWWALWCSRWASVIAWLLGQRREMHTKIVANQIECSVLWLLDKHATATTNKPTRRRPTPTHALAAYEDMRSGLSNTLRELARRTTQLLTSRPAAAAQVMHLPEEDAPMQGPQPAPPQPPEVNQATDIQVQPNKMIQFLSRVRAELVVT